MRDRYRQRETEKKREFPPFFSLFTLDRDKRDIDRHRCFTWKGLFSRFSCSMQTGGKDGKKDGKTQRGRGAQKKEADRDLLLGLGQAVKEEREKETELQRRKTGKESGRQRQRETDRDRQTDRQTEKEKLNRRG